MTTGARYEGVVLGSPRREAAPSGSATGGEGRRKVAPRASRVGMLRFTLGLLPVPTTLAFQLAFWSAIRPFGLFLFVQAAYISSWIGGLYAGLIGTIAGGIVCFYFFVPPERTWAVAEPRHFIVLGLFVVLGVVISVFHERFRRATRLLERTKDEAGHLYRKAKQVDELKTNLFAGVSHELRTPLTLVLGPAERLAAAPIADVNARRDIQLIARSARTLLHYVDDLLEVTRLEARSVEPEYEETDLARLVRFVASNFELAARAKGMTYVVEAPTSLQAQVDPAKVQRVLLNLVSNALKFTPEGGRVRLTLREDDARARVLFEVADSGPGIRKDEREAVFNAYLQHAGRTARRHAGTGLGLPIARELVVLHGGSVVIGDAPEGGASVLVDLPRTAPHGAKVKPARTEEPSEAVAAEARSFVEEIRRLPPDGKDLSGRAGGPIVLVVEDSPDMNDAICSVLRREYWVATAFDGEEGLEKALELLPDLVLTDVMMPGMSGEELVRALRARPELATTPVIALTAVADEQSRVQLLLEGARDYVTKPFRPEELLARVDGAIAERRAERRITALSAQLEAVSRASMTVSEAVARLPHESVDAVLHTIASEAQELTNAQFVAVGLGTDPDRPFDPWVFVGMSPEQEAAIGRHPRPVGVLGIAARSDQPMRVRDVRRHPGHVPFPPGHPEMSSFLSVPIRHRDRSLGHVYLANKLGADDFTDADQKVVEMLASRAAVAVETARLYEAEGIERAWLEAVIDQLPDAVMLLDAGGRIALLNGAAATLRCPEGGPRDGLGNAMPLDLCLPDGAPVAPDDVPYVRALARGESAIGVDLQIRKPDGELLPVSASAVPIRSGDGGRRPTGAIAVFRDVSAQKQLERLRAEWSAVIAHDLRQPVGVISFAAELARRSHVGPMPDVEAKQFERIKEADRRLAEMIDELLDATRLESRQLTIEAAEIDVAATAREVCDRMLDVTHGHAVRVRASGSSQVAWADPRRVEQVIANLVSNASKYGAAGTDIQVDVEGRDDKVEVTVTNQGRGIPPEELSGLFQRFMRSKTAAGIAGIGLGLYICKGLVEAHGGRMWVESTPGETTSFHFTLPARPRGDDDIHRKHAGNTDAPRRGPHLAPG
jgi:PAS domain S-box-containing protein